MKPAVNFFVATLSVAIAWSPTLSTSGTEPPSPSFRRDIRPIFNAHCVECHGGVKQAGDISFVQRDAALSVIEPGNPEESILMDRVTSDDEFEIMPPPEHGAPLSEKEIATLRTWIREGAEWMQPWAYEPPEATTQPEVSRAQWCRQPVDRFVLARLDSESIVPAPDAPPAQWLRRVTLDLTGLPPTPEEHDAFLIAAEQDGDSAYEETVDRLLNSNAYGERWASVWLDQIRYADSRGLGADGRREIWKYRDWVIDAFNDDMPFDQFTIKQIAGDLLPEPTIDDLVATAANRLTQTNEEGGTDDEEFRINAVLDRVSTVWQTWQGITFGCVQCHSHPYDPLQHDEFYKFSAFFNNTADCDLNEELPLLAVPLDRKDNAQANALDRKIRSLQQSIWERESILLDDDFGQWKNITNLNASASKETEVAVEPKADRAEFFTVDTLSSNTEITLNASLKDIHSLAAVRLTISPGDPVAAKADSEWGFVLSHVKATVSSADSDPVELSFSRVVGDEPFPFKNPDDSLNSKSNNGFAAYSRIHHPRTAVFVLDSPVDVPENGTLNLVMKNGITLLGAFPLVARRGHVSVSDQPVFQEQLQLSELQKDRDALSQAIAERNKIPNSKIPILSERVEHLRRPTHVFTRGLFLTKGEEVEAGVPAALPPLPEGMAADRLALAQWLINGKNPLTARVTANRVWARLFGIGIVATEEDFGSSGEAPSHPMLLDSLALQFQSDGWSFKKLIRSIVLSSTYRQDARIRAELSERDSNNRLLARGPRFRMPAEMIRDGALFVSGLLSPTMHGKPVHPPIPAGIWKPFRGGDKWDTPDTGNPDRYRRSIYTYTKRSIPYPMFAAFDAPSREFCTPRRLRSNTPLQALMTLNDTTFVECSQALGERLKARQAESGDGIRFGFLAVTSREPLATEVDALQQLYDQCRSEDESTGAQCWTAVASVLLNLDEIMSK